MKVEEEYQALQQQLAHRRSLSREAASSGRQPAERSACVVAAVPLGGCGEAERQLLGLHGVRGGEALVGTLDLYAVRAMPGEVLIGAHRLKRMHAMMRFSNQVTAGAATGAVLSIEGCACGADAQGCVMSPGSPDCAVAGAYPERVLMCGAGDCRNPAYLANVCVAAAAQRQGIGRRLIQTALVDVARLGCAQPSQSDAAAVPAWPCLICLSRAHTTEAMCCRA